MGKVARGLYGGLGDAVQGGFALLVDLVEVLLQVGEEFSGLVLGWGLCGGGGGGY